jgi:hypothetical protein
VVWYPKGVCSLTSKADGGLVAARLVKRNKETRYFMGGQWKKSRQAWMRVLKIWK